MKKKYLLNILAITLTTFLCTSCTTIDSNVSDPHQTLTKQSEQKIVKKHKKVKKAKNIKKTKKHTQVLVEPTTQETHTIKEEQTSTDTQATSESIDKN